jgi:hypothetical protein
VEPESPRDGDRLSGYRRAEIGARTSKLYVTPFGTALLILTIELYGVSNSANLQDVARHRIVNKVLGVAIALFYGLLISWLLELMVFRRSRYAPTA